MISFVQQYGRNIHSQNGEDGIIAECVKRLGIERGHAVEIGANNGLWMSNTRALIESGWSALMVESDWNLYRECVANWKDNDRVRVQCCHVTHRDVNAFVDKACDVLSTDTEGWDFDIFGALDARPKIVVVEIDSSFPPDVTDFNRDGGASYRAMLRLGINMGYFLLCHTGNLIFVRGDFRSLFPEIAGDGLTNADLYFNRGWLAAEAAEAA